MGCANSQLDLEKTIIPSFISEPVYPHLYFGTMCQDRDSPTATKKLRKSKSLQLITKRRVCSPCMISSGRLKLHMHKCIQPFPAPHTYTRTWTRTQAHTHTNTQCNNNDIVFKKQIKSGRAYLCSHLKGTHTLLAGNVRQVEPEAPRNMTSEVREESEMNVDTRRLFSFLVSSMQYPTARKSVTYITYPNLENH